MEDHREIPRRLNHHQLLGLRMKQRHVRSSGGEWPLIVAEGVGPGKA
jgi:hypothetical protein